MIEACFPLRPKIDIAREGDEIVLELTQVSKYGKGIRFPAWSALKLMPPTEIPPLGNWALVAGFSQYQRSSRCHGLPSTCDVRRNSKRIGGLSRSTDLWIAPRRRSRPAIRIFTWSHLRIHFCSIDWLFRGLLSEKIWNLTGREDFLGAEAEVSREFKLDYKTVSKSKTVSRQVSKTRIYLKRFGSALREKYLSESRLWRIYKGRSVLVLWVLLYNSFWYTATFAQVVYWIRWFLKGSCGFLHLSRLRHEWNDLDDGMTEMNKQPPSGEWWMQSKTGKWTQERESNSPHECFLEYFTVLMKLLQDRWKTAVTSLEINTRSISLENDSLNAAGGWQEHLGSSTCTVDVLKFRPYLSLHVFA